MAPEERSAWLNCIRAAIVSSPTIITQHHFLDREVVTLLRKGDFTRVREIIAHIVDPSGDYSHNYEIDCEQCGKWHTVNTSKTAMLNLIFKKCIRKYDKAYQFTRCPECYALILEKERHEKEQREQQVREAQLSKPERTMNWIGNVLDAGRSWKDKAKMRDYFSGMTNEAMFLDSALIEDYIRGMDYGEFLKTPYWKCIAYEVKRRAGWQCSLCAGKENLRAHHKTYDRHGREHVFYKDDLICLCEKCHHTFHGVDHAS